MILLTLKKHEAHTWEEQTPGLWGRRGGREEDGGKMGGEGRGSLHQQSPQSPPTHHSLSGDSWALTLHPVPPLNLRS